MFWYSISFPVVKVHGLAASSVSGKNWLIGNYEPLMQRNWLLCGLELANLLGIDCEKFVRAYFQRLSKEQKFSNVHAPLLLLDPQYKGCALSQKGCQFSLADAFVEPSFSHRFYERIVFRCVERSNWSLVGHTTKLNE